MTFENPTINWNNIRPNKGSQNSGFEELVCQLAHFQSFNDAKFTRVGTPDGGVEAYWTFSDGSEYGWQAKYFTAWDNSQWKQIKASFDHSLKTHPQLKCYYICTPLDRPDARLPRAKSAMQHWQELESDAKDKGVELVYWGNSELVRLLSQEENQGLRYYWFNEQVLSKKWFADHIERGIKNLGPRYTPEINVNLKISQQFDILRRNQSCYERHTEYYENFIKEIRKNIKYLPLSDKFINWEELKRLQDDLKNLFLFQNTRDSIIDIGAIKENLKGFSTWVEKQITGFDENKKNGIPHGELTKEQIDTYCHNLDEINHTLYNFRNVIDSHYLSLFNRGSVLLCGDAGAGKSHLLASVAVQCIKDGIPCILLLGQHFSDHSSPWQQILKSHLGLNCDTHTFLQILNNFGKNYNQRILFMVDAINEGAGIQFWPHYLSGFVNDFKEYKYISLVITVRSSYIDYFRESIGDALCYVEHHGFSDDEACNAQEIFFDYYGLQHPNVPLLNPEFNNPLFLKLFCSGLNKAGLSSVPKGTQGLFRIFDFFLEHSSNSIYTRHKQISPSLKIIQKIIDAIVHSFIQNDKHFINYSEAAEIVASVASRFGIYLGTEILDELISEGIFAKDITWDPENNRVEVLRFSYERLENIEKAKQLLKDVNKEDLKQLFIIDGKLYFCRYDLAMLETLSILIPEKYKCELYSVFPEEDIDHNIASSFLQSLLWRSWDTINKEFAKEFINSCVLSFEYTASQFIETLYAVAAEEGHPFNAETLHSWLSKYNMAKRDSFWTTRISKNYYSNTPISRFIDWCHNYGYRMIDGEKSTLLTATALSWLFTATNNSLRDNATFALTKLLVNHLKTALYLLKNFWQVDDPYIHERIWAAVYGAVLNSSEKAELPQLAQWITDNFFSAEEVYPNVLVRDYARNIVTYACYIKCFELDDHLIIEPPYNSSFPNELPEDDYVKQFDLPYNTPDLPKNYEAQRAIIHSMVTEYGHGIGGYGDFGRYVFQGKLDSWDCFDIQVLSNYAISLIFDKYGYDIELHGDFDRYERSYGRERQQIERIGKKYQWLAMHEVAARLADNFQIVIEKYPQKEYCYYSGTWEPFFRDIDPSYMWSCQKPLSSNNPIFSYNAWNENAVKWIQDSSDIPAFSEILEYKDSSPNIWVVLTGSLSWQKEFYSDDVQEELQQRVSSIIASCFVQVKDLEALKHSLKTKCSGHEFVNMHSQYKIYFREYFWSPAYKFFENSPYYESEYWKEFEEWQEKSPAPKIMLPTNSYVWESSCKDSVSQEIPCKYFADFFRLTPGENCGEWISAAGEIICREIRINDYNKKLFVVRKDKILEFLATEKLALIWSCYAEKISCNSNYTTMHTPLELAESYILNSGKPVKICSKII